MSKIMRRKRKFLELKENADKEIGLKILDEFKEKKSKNLIGKV